MAAAAASPDAHAHLPATPPRTPIAPTRYPSHLSRRMASEGPSRPLLQHRGTSHMYETLEDLLKEAGYKETRIFTPEGTQRTPSSANKTPTKSSTNENGTVGGTVVKLLSTFIARHVDPESPTPPARVASKANTSNSASTSSRALRHTISAPQIPRRRGPGSQHGPAPPSPSWLTSLFSPRTPPSTPVSQRRRPTTPRLRPTTPRLVSAQSRAASSHVAVTITNVVCRPAPSRKGSASSNRSSKSSRASSSSRSGSRDRKDVPMLVCECDKDRMYSPSDADADAEDADSSDDEDEIDLSRILIPAKRQHSIRSLRTVLLHHQQRRSPTQHRRISSLNPSRDRPRTPTTSSDENSYYPGTSPDATPRPHRRYALTNNQSSLPARITREPLHEEPSSVEIETDSAGNGGEEGHWDSGEFMNARIKRRRSGLPRGWTAWRR